MSNVMAATPKAKTGGRGGPGRKRVPRAEREAQMLAAATKVFARRGLRASMDEIAAEAGITKPMLYAYFDSKEGLLAAAAEAAGAKLRRQLRDLTDRRDVAPDERLWLGFNLVFDFVEHHRDAWVLLYPGGQAGGGTLGGGAIRAREAMAALLAELFSRTARESGMGEQAAAQSEVLAHAVTAATIASASWWLEHPDEQKELVILRLMNLVWMGFGDLLGGRLWLPAELRS
jgi:AcrR family transcriptional regulator